VQTLANIYISSVLEHVRKLFRSTTHSPNGTMTIVLRNSVRSIANARYTCRTPIRCFARSSDAAQRVKEAVDPEKAKQSSDPRLRELGRVIEDEYAALRAEYSKT